MNAPRIYRPEHGSLADRVCTWFRANPEEEMSNGDIAQKFDTLRSAVSAGLLAPRANGVLQFVRTDGGMVWRAGPQLAATPPANATPTPVPTPAAWPPSPKAKAMTHTTAPSTTSPARTQSGGALKQLPMLDAAALTVRVDDPIPPKRCRPKGVTKYDAVFERLQTTGQSLLLPVQYHGAVAKALQVYSKRTGRQFALRTADAQHVGLWRVG